MNNLKELRVKSGYAQADIAKYLNVTQQAYSRYERGESELGYAAEWTISAWSPSRAGRLRFRQRSGNCFAVFALYRSAREKSLQTWWPQWQEKAARRAALRKGHDPQGAYCKFTVEALPDGVKKA